MHVYTFTHSPHPRTHTFTPRTITRTHTLCIPSYTHHTHSLSHTCSYTLSNTHSHTCAHSHTHLSIRPCTHMYSHSPTLTHKPLLLHQVYPSQSPGRGATIRGLNAGVESELLRPLEWLLTPNCHRPCRCWLRLASEVWNLQLFCPSKFQASRKHKTRVSLEWGKVLELEESVASLLSGLLYK